MTERLDVDDRLRRAADMFVEKSNLYGDNYLTCAKIMTMLFPNGITLSSESDFLRISLLGNVFNKATRYVASGFDKPHDDSSWDLSIYSMMLNAADALPKTDDKPSTEPQNQCTNNIEFAWIAAKESEREQFMKDHAAELRARFLAPSAESKPFDIYFKKNGDMTS